MAVRVAKGVALALAVVMASGSVAEARHAASKTASRCAKDDELTAEQVAALQQELMVAALTCNDVPHFNAFQTNYHSDLLLSDKRLLTLFKRVYGRTGESQYHAYKTRLANDHSMRAIHDAAGYCQEAAALFAKVEAADRPSLEAFVDGADTHETSPVDSCSVMEAEANIPDVVPTPNPVRVAELVDTPVTAAGPAPAAAQQAASVPAAPSAVPAVDPAAKAPADKDGDSGKKSGWLSGVFR